MSEYRVSWSIDIDASSPEAAAEQAEQLMCDQTRLGNVFAVKKRGRDEVKLIEVTDGVGRLFGGHNG